MINKLFISTQQYNWGDRADLSFVNFQSLRNAIQNPTLIDCWSTPEDLSSLGLQLAIENATEIYLVDIDINNFDTNNIFCYGRLFNEITKHRVKVKNYSEINLPDQLLSTRPTANRVLWTVGCSVTAGVGVSQEQRYANILASALKVPHASLALSGASIFLSADQIMRADLKSGDTVVWGLTGIHRVEIAKKWEFKSVTISTYSQISSNNKYWSLDYFDSQTQALQAIRIVKQVINFCQRAQVDLYIANILDLTWFRVMFDNLDNFIDLTDSLKIVNDNVQFIDLGTDNSHPGPKQHQQYADKLLTLIEEKHHGKTI